MKIVRVETSKRSADKSETEKRVMQTRGPRRLPPFGGGGKTQSRKEEKGKKESFKPKGGCYVCKGPHVMRDCSKFGSLLAKLELKGTDVPHGEETNNTGSLGLFKDKSLSNNGLLSGGLLSKGLSSDGLPSSEELSDGLLSKGLASSGLPSDGQQSSTLQIDEWTRRAACHKGNKLFVSKGENVQQAR